jgi:hypothetical protein
MGVVVGGKVSLLIKPYLGCAGAVLTCVMRLKVFRAFDDASQRTQLKAV